MPEKDLLKSAMVATWDYVKVRSRSVERRSETIINSTYCRFLCFISLHTVGPRYNATPLLRGFGYNAVGRGPRISAARGKCQMGPLKPT